MKQPGPLNIRELSEGLSAQEREGERFAQVYHKHNLNTATVSDFGEHNVISFLAVKFGGSQVPEGGCRRGHDWRGWHSPVTHLLA